MGMQEEFKINRIILGVKVLDKPVSFVMQKVKEFLGSSGQYKIYTPNSEICLKAAGDSEYRKILNKSDINIPDAIGLKFGAKILGQNLKNRITGVDLSKNILNFLEKNTEHQNCSVYVLLRNDSLTSLKEIQEKLPNLKIFGTQINHLDYLNSSDKAIEEINKIKPTVLFSCLGAPWQEKWIETFLEKIPSVKLSLGVGGTFDFLTDKIKRAPKLMRKTGLEWLYRLYQEPKRLKRIKNATAGFLLKCHEWKSRIKTEYRQNVLGVIYNKQGKILIQNNKRMKDNQHWQFTQGGVDKNESLRIAIVREMSEELGPAQEKFEIIGKLPVTYKYIWPKWSQFLYGYKGQEQQIFLLRYLGDDNDFDFSLEDEVKEVKWVNKKDLKKHLHKVRQNLLKKIFDYL